MSQEITGRSRYIRRLLGGAVITALAAPLALIAPASADTTPPTGITVTASTTGSGGGVGQTNVAPNSTALTGLVNGTVVTVTANASTPGTLFGIEARLCKDTANMGFQSEFTPDEGGNCIFSAFNAQSDEYKSQSAAGSTPIGNTSATLTFRVGTGTQTFALAGGGTSTITCNATTPCDLWIQAAVAASAAPNADQSGVVFVHYDLLYAGSPGAPTAVNGVGTNNDATVTFAAPANTGNAPLYQYDVTLTGPGGSTQTVAAGTTSVPFSGLTPGAAYTVSVIARNRAVNGTTSDSPAGTGAFTQGVGAASRVEQHLTAERPNGLLILTQVCGRTGSNASGGAPTTGTGPTDIEVGGVTDPAFTAGEYPTPTVPLYPTHCAVPLTTGKLMSDGAFFRSTGNLSQVSVSDARDLDLGWAVTGQMGTFARQGAAVTGRTSFSGNQLGWTPAVAGFTTSVDSEGVTYTQTVQNGPVIPPNKNAAAGPPRIGTAPGATLASALPGNAASTTGGLGVARLDAGLELWMPVNVRAGTYAGTLTITLSSN